ncbi:MAG: hypothetical protein ACXVX1_07150 [Mycobacterium sp.]
MAMVVGGYQLWFASRCLHTAATNSDGIGFLVQGHEHYPMTFHNFNLWLNGEAALSVMGGAALIAGAVLAGIRKAVGLKVIVGGCLAVIAHTGVGWIVATKMIHWFVLIGADDYGLLWFDAPNRAAIVVLSFALPAVAAVIALVSGDRARRRTAHIFR